MTFTLDKFSLADKVAIVTGAGGRPNSIGEAYALGLAAAGAAVVAADINQAGAEAVAAKVKAAGGAALGVGVDITNPDSAAAMAKAAESAFGGIDILVNNAAIMAEMVDGSMSGSAMNVPLDQWDRWFAVNLKGALICSRAVAPSMIARGGGRIVNQVSAGAFPAEGVYGVTKLALVGLTTSLARELGSQKISVNAIAPGMTTSGAGESLAPAGSPGRAAMEARTAIGIGEPDDLVGALLLLCSPAGRWITGQVVHVDGGWVMRP